MQEVSLTTQIEASAREVSDFLACDASGFNKKTYIVHPINERSCLLEEKLVSKNMDRSLKILKRRHKTLNCDLVIKKRYPTSSLRILISGSGGLVGTRLTSFLKTMGHDIHTLKRGSSNQSNTVIWDPYRGHYKLEDFEGFDAVFHLAGKNISSVRWTKKSKEEIFRSRVRDTWLLSQIFLRVKNKPKVFIPASALGFYGNRGEEDLTEASGVGMGFLADLCKRWETASESLKKEEVRVIQPRFGVILSKKGGMLARLIPLFQWGLGAILGSGKQYISWIMLDDVIYALYHCLTKQSIIGPVNVVTPFPETFEEFAKKLARVLHRPLFFHINEKILRCVFKEMADEVFLSSIKAHPEKLVQTRFQFYYPTLDQAFTQLFS